METKHDWDCLLVKAMGLVLVTVALVWLPDALGGLVQLGGTVFMDHSAADGEWSKWIHQFQRQLTAASVGKIVSVIVLLLIARWVFGYPKILQKALKRVDDA